MTDDPDSLGDAAKRGGKGGAAQPMVKRATASGEPNGSGQCIRSSN